MSDEGIGRSESVMNFKSCTRFQQFSIEAYLCTYNNVNSCYCIYKWCQPFSTTNEVSGNTSEISLLSYSALRKRKLESWVTAAKISPSFCSNINTTKGGEILSYF